MPPPATQIHHPVCTTVSGTALGHGLLALKDSTSFARFDAQSSMSQDHAEGCTCEVLCLASIGREAARDRFTEHGSVSKNVKGKGKPDAVPDKQA